MDAKYFQRGKVHELRIDLNNDKHDKINIRKNALKKVIANISMGNDMSGLFPEVLSNIDLPLLEAKKMVYLYLVIYGRQFPSMAVNAIPALVRDASNQNPLIRALAIRTMSNIQVDSVLESLVGPLRTALADKDPYVCKTAAICVSKMYFYNPLLVLKEGFLESLKGFLEHDNPMVIANTVACLVEIASRSDQFEFSLDDNTANRLITVLQECSEWCQIYILEALTSVEPENESSAEIFCERISPHLKHSNSAVALTSVRVILYLMGYIRKPAILASLLTKVGPPLVTLLQASPEIQYVALRNIQLIIQRHKGFLRNDFKVFFCKYNDPIFVKLAKLEILFQLTDADNIKTILSELKEYASEVDVDFVSKAVRCIGRFAIKVESEADACVQVLMDLIQTRVNYVVQESIVVLKYPNQYESIIGPLCDNLETLEIPEAKASMIWIIGQYAERIENAQDLLEQFLESFLDESNEVQLALLTAIVKLFIKRPTVGQELVPKVLKLCTEDSDNPDVRDRGFVYWRLLSTDPVLAKAIILGDRPTITVESDNLDGSILSKLLYNIASLSSLTHRPPPISVNLSNRLLALHKIVLETQGQTFIQKAQSEANEIDRNPYIVDEDNFEVKKNQQILDLLSLDTEPVNYSGQTDFALGGIPLDLFSGNNEGIVANNLVSDDLDVFAAAKMSPGKKSASINQNPTDTIAAMQANIDISKTLAGMKLMTETNQNILNTQPNLMPMYPTYMTNNSLPQNQPTNIPMNYGTNSAATAPSNPNIKPLQPLDLTASRNPVIDPFSSTANSQRSTGGNALASISAGGYVPTKVVWLDAVNGRGLEILGTFYRKNGKVYMDMTLTNRSLDTLTQFAILFNKNSFGLAVAIPMDNSAKLGPNQSMESVLQLKIDGLAVLTSPINNLQIAMKTNAGILYLQALVPLHILFVEGQALNSKEWLNMWNGGQLSSNEIQTQIALQPSNSNVYKAKLENNNLKFVAERTVSGLILLYGEAKLEDGSLFLLELKFEQGYAQCTISSRTFATHLSHLFHESIHNILRS